jgi:predicted nucleic acid-binding protein
VTLSTVDALLAALALEFDAAFFTLDRDFERLAFTGLRLHRGKGGRVLEGWLDGDGPPGL